MGKSETGDHESRSAYETISDRRKRQEGEYSSVFYIISKDKTEAPCENNINPSDIFGFQVFKHALVKTYTYLWI